MTSPRMTVFLVDDDEAVRHALTVYMKSVNLNVESFDSAERFLDEVPEDARGVLVLDQRMNGITGLDLQAILNERNVILPIVFITGHGDVATCVSAMKAGAVDFIEKPFRNEQLLECIKKAYKREKHDYKIAAAKAGARARYEDLTRREREVMDYIVQGISNKNLAERLGVSTRTIEVHRSKVMQKMQARSLPELVRMAALLEPVNT